MNITDIENYITDVILSEYRVVSVNSVKQVPEYESISVTYKIHGNNYFFGSYSEYSVTIKLNELKTWLRQQKINDLTKI